MVGHECKGVFRLTITPDFDRATSTDIDKSVNKGINASLVKFDNEIFYLNPEGLFRYDKNQLKFVIDPMLSKEIKPEEYVTGKMIDDNNGRLWMFSKNRVHFLRRGVFRTTEV